MQIRKDYLAGVPCYVESGRREPEPAMDFYGGLLGWEFENVSPEGAPRYHMARLHGHIVAGIGEQPDQTWDPSWNTYVRTDDADATAAKVREAGGKVTVEPFAIGPAGRLAYFEDAEGAAIAAWEAGTTRGVELVNDPGSWVSSELASRDHPAATAFYRAVFGWDTRPLGDTTMFVRPGYADHLAEDDPELFDRLEQYEAPDGFGDLVAYLLPQGDEPARWGVTFSVTDADASAARARELGGSVLAEPFDAPWVRVTVIRDPEGAVLTLSQFVPPEPS